MQARRISSPLLGRCPEAIYAGSRVLQAMHAWVAGLSEMAARHAISPGMSSSCDNRRNGRISRASRLASPLAQFDDNAIISTERKRARVGNRANRPDRFHRLRAGFLYERRGGSRVPAGLLAR